MMNKKTRQTRLCLLDKIPDHVLGQVMHYLSIHDHCHILTRLQKKFTKLCTWQGSWDKNLSIDLIDKQHLGAAQMSRILDGIGRFNARPKTLSVIFQPINDSRENADAKQWLWTSNPGFTQLTSQVCKLQLGVNLGYAVDKFIAQLGTTTIQHFWFWGRLTSPVLDWIEKQETLADLHIYLPNDNWYGMQRGSSTVDFPQRLSSLRSTIQSTITISTPQQFGAIAQGMTRAPICLAFAPGTPVQGHHLDHFDAPTSKIDWSTVAELNLQHVYPNGYPRMLQHLSTLTGLKRLNLAEENDPEDSLTFPPFTHDELRDLKSLPNLQELTLAITLNSFDPETTRLGWLDNLPNLTKIVLHIKHHTRRYVYDHLDHMKINNGLVQTFAAKTNGLGNLQILEVFGDQTLTDDEVGQIIARLPRLRQLGFSSLRLTRHVLPHLAKLPCLKQLRLCVGSKFAVPDQRLSELVIREALSKLSHFEMDTMIFDSELRNKSQCVYCLNRCGSERGECRTLSIV